MNFVTELTSALVVERRGLDKLDTAEMAIALADIYSRGKKVIMVKNSNHFFSLKNLSAALDDPSQNDNFVVIMEKREISIDTAELKLIEDFHALKNRILNEAVESSDVSSYPFAKVPADWSFEKNITVTSKHVRRTNSTQYSIGIKTLQRIWNEASKFWAGLSTDQVISGIQASGYYNDGTINSQTVKIGCREILRYELEQTALAMDWEFPKETL